MSLPLHDLGSVKVSERDHSYLRAVSLSKRIDVTTLVRDWIEERVNEELHVHTVAQQIHEAKGFGKINGDCK
jgi:hypothetical protein